MNRAELHRYGGAHRIIHRKMTNVSLRWLAAVESFRRDTGQPPLSMNALAHLLASMWSHLK